MRLAEVVHGEQFTDECDFGGAVVTTVHRLEPKAGSGSEHCTTPNPSRSPSSTGWPDPNC